MRFAQFMATPFGRGIRIVAGIILIGAGIITVATGGTAVVGIILVAVGALFATVGALNVCPLALLFRGPFSGRAALAARDAADGAARETSAASA
ncbi:YgaP-like transmembrane domain [Microbacterium gorillae]|uniref:YgaP-like transmembrane domain n=1 Tax=Microbacterium gorillae TaxID=1231063 RepID=UPI00058BF6CC|nr:YgaP-like transmembrane domain [Microbacterium gorillae]